MTVEIRPLHLAASVALLGEDLTATLVAGGLLTVAGVGVIVLRRPRVAGGEVERV